MRRKLAKSALSTLHRFSDQIDADRQLREHFWNPAPKVDVDRHSRTEVIHEEDYDPEAGDSS